MKLRVEVYEEVRAITTVEVDEDEYDPDNPDSLDSIVADRDVTNDIVYEVERQITVLSDTPDEDDHDE